MSTHDTTENTSRHAAAVDEVVDAALSIRELAARLGVSPQTLYDLRSQGRGPTGFRVGRHLRFRQSEIPTPASRPPAPCRARPRSPAG